MNTINREDIRVDRKREGKRKVEDEKSVKMFKIENIQEIKQNISH